MRRCHAAGPRSASACKPAATGKVAGHTAATAALLFLLSGAAHADLVTDTLKTGANPSAMAVNPITHTAYVVNSGGNSVSVINCLTRQVMATVPVDSNPVAVAVNAVTNRIYVANQGGNSVTVIDGSDHRAARIAVGEGPAAIAVNGSTNRIYVANKAGNSVTRILGESHATRTIPVGKAPKAIAVNPATDRIYVADSADNAVTVIDGVSEDTAGIAVGTGPGALGVNPATDRIYVANSQGASVTVIDGATQAVLATVATGVTPVSVTVNPAVNLVYVANRDNLSITVIKGGDHSAANVFVGNTPVAVAVNPATNKVYVANWLGKSLSILNGETNALKTLALHAGPAALAVDPLLNRIYAVHPAASEVSDIDGASYDSTRVGIGARGWGTPAVNPVTNRIYLATNQGVVQIDGETGAATQIHIGDTVSQVAVNPVTNRIYVAASNGKIGVIDGSNRAVKVLTVAGQYDDFDAIAVNPVTNKVYVSADNDTYIGVLDGATQGWKTVFSQGWINEFAVDPAANRIYTAGGSVASELDGAAELARTLGIGSVGGVAVNPVTQKVYASLSKTDSVAILDKVTGAIVRVQTDSPSVLAVNPVTNRIYVGCGSSKAGTLTVIDGATNKTTAIPMGVDDMDGIAVNQVLNKIYIVCRSRAAIFVVDGETHRVEAIWSLSFDGGIAVNPVTGKAYKTYPWFGSSGKEAVVLTDAPTADTRLRAVIESPLEPFSFEARPEISGKGVNRLRPGLAGLLGVATGIGTLRKPLTWATVTGGAGTDSIQWRWNWGGDSLTLGENYLAAVAVDSQGNSGNPVILPFYRLQQPPLAAPSPLTPADSSSGGNRVVLSWTPVADAEFYSLVWSAFPDFRNPTFERLSGTSKSLHWEATAKGNTPFYWRVNAANAGGATPWTKTMAYIVSAPAQPRLAYEGWSVDTLPASNDFRWYRVPTAVSYHLEITRNRQSIYSDWPADSPILFRDSTIRDTVIQVGSLAPDSIYSYQLRAKNAEGTVSYWQRSWFRQRQGGPSDVALPGADLPRNYSLKLSANLIRYALPARALVTLKLYDLQGRLAAIPLHAEQGPGYYALPLKGQGLSRGAFILAFEAGPFSRRALVSVPGD